jgi:glycosyltransferase involved in cell wall biosynthesis
MSGFEENEISKKAFGGTELAKRQLGNLIDENLLNEFQIIPSRIRELEDDKIRILWLHDLPEDPMYSELRDPNYLKNFHKFVFVSNFQYSRFQNLLNFPYDSRSIVLETGIAPSDVVIAQKPDPADGIRIVYNTTPHRGLELLVPVFEYLANTYMDIHLDVFSSYKIYGWDDADSQFEPLYDRIRNHPRMTYHGFQPNDVVLNHLKGAHIQAYPSIWMETSCRALIEAMSAGLVCVHPNFGALPDTSGGLNIMYQGETDNNAHANIFVNMLHGAISLVRDKKHERLIDFNKYYVDQRFNINRVANQWTQMLQALAAQYPTPESRKLPSGPTLIYKTS